MLPSLCSSERRRRKREGERERDRERKVTSSTCRRGFRKLAERLGAAVIRCGRHVGSLCCWPTNPFPPPPELFTAPKLPCSKFSQWLGVMWKRTALSVRLPERKGKKKKTQTKRQPTAEDLRRPWDEQEVQLALESCCVTKKKPRRVLKYAVQMSGRPTAPGFVTEGEQEVGASYF